MTVRVGADLRRAGTQLWLFRGRARAAVSAAEDAVLAEGGRAGGGGNAQEAMVRAGVDLGRYGQHQATDSLAYGETQGDNRPGE